MTVAAGARPRLAAFLAGVLTWSWAPWLAAAILDLRADDPPGALLFLLGGAGPSAVALILVRRAYSPAERREFARRVLDPRRISPPWLVAIVVVGLAPALSGWAAAAVLGEELAGGAGAGALDAAGVVGFALVAGVAEELGWRGYALDRLGGHGGVAAGIAIGAIWAVWHLPLYLLPGTFHHGLGLGSVEFWALSASLLPLSVLMVWICVGTRRSILAAIVVHALGNIGGELVPGEEAGARLAVLALTLALALLVAARRRHT